MSKYDKSSQGSTFNLTVNENTPPLTPPTPTSTDIEERVMTYVIKAYNKGYDDRKPTDMEPYDYMTVEQATEKILALIQQAIDVARIDELKLLLEDWDMAEREPGDLKVHEYKDFETIRERLAQLEGKK